MNNLNNSFNLEVSFDNIPLKPHEWKNMAFISGIKLKRITSKCLKDLLLYNSTVDSKDKILLLSDTKNAIAIRLDKNGRVTKRSFLSYRQDESVCEFACHLKITNLDYSIENKIKYDSTLDHETMIRNYIVDNIKKSTDEDKAKYVYYLFFNRISDYSKDKLLESVKSEDYEKCQKIYDFLIQN